MSEVDNYILSDDLPFAEKGMQVYTLFRYLLNKVFSDSE